MNLAKSAVTIQQNDEKYLHKIESQKRKAEYKQSSKRYRTILTGLEKGTIKLNLDKNDHLQRLYREGLGHSKQYGSLKMKASTDLTDLGAERVTLDIFSSVGNIAPAPKYDPTIP